MRRNFYEILNASQLNLRTEYERIYSILFCAKYFRTPIIDIISENFDFLPEYIRGRTLSLGDFNETYEFNFAVIPATSCVDDIISICEYGWNLCSSVQKYAYNMNDQDSYDINQALRIIDTTIRALYHKPIVKDKITIFVPEKQDVVAVAEFVETEVALNILEYNHYTLKGKLAKKKAILQIMANNIEPQRKTLNSINRTLADNLFQMFQKFKMFQKTKNPAKK